MKPLAALLVLLSATAWSAPVRIRVVGDTCPLAAQLKQASSLTVVDAEPDFDAMLEREGDEWRVLLKKPDGTVALRRTLSGAKLCADVTFAAQLILERFARELDVKVAVPTPTPPIPPKPKPTPAPLPTPPVPEPPLPPKPEPPPAPEPVPAPPPPLVLIAPPAAETSVARPGPIGARPHPLRVSRVEASASGGAWIDGTARPGLVVEAAVFLSERWRLGAQFAATTPQTSLVTDPLGIRGTLTTQPFLGLVSGGYCLAPNVRLCGNVVAGAHLESGTTEGANIFQQRNVWLAQPAVGLEVQVAWLPIPEVPVALSGTALVLPIRGAWTITGTMFSQSPPLFEGLVRLSIGFGANR